MIQAELAGWREALTTRAILVAIALRLLAAGLLVTAGILGASRPVLTLCIVLGTVLVSLLVWIRLGRRL